MYTEANDGNRPNRIKADWANNGLRLAAKEPVNRWTSYVRVLVCDLPASYNQHILQFVIVGISFSSHFATYVNLYFRNYARPR